MAEELGGDFDEERSSRDERMQFLYAIGDIHGRADLLAALLSAIEKDASEKEIGPTVIFLGDIIDRGPNSRQAMDLVLQTLNRFPASRFILGNHDACLKAFINGTYTDNLATTWISLQGEMKTLEPYFTDRPRSLDEINDTPQEKFDHHRELLDRAVDKVVIGNFCLVHAGIRPGVPLDEQDPHDLRWIREEFLQHTEPFEKVIVHGHTPTESNLPEIHPNRARQHRR